MIEKRFFKKKRNFLLILFIFLFNLTSILFFPHNILNPINKSKNSDNSFHDLRSFIHYSNGPENATYFNYYKTIIINHEKVNGTLNNFPLLISLNDSDLKYEAQPDGDDIAFYNGTQWLDHEIEVFNQTYSETHAQFIAWIRVPILYDDKDTVIYMYYGNATIGPQENPSGVWDNNYKGVWHLREDPSGSSPQMKDSTSNNNHGNATNLYSGDQINGQIDGSIDFDGGTACDLIDCGNETSLNMGSGEFSLSTWFNYDGEKWGAIVGKGAVLSTGKRYQLSFNTPAGQIFAEIDDDSAPTNPYITSGTTYGDNKWHHLVMVRDEAYLRLYLDGNEDGTQSVSGYGNIDSKYPLYMNAKCDINGQLSSWSSVKLDEVRVSNSARSADWIATEFNNQNDTSSFYSVSTAKETLPTSNFEYYKKISIDHTKVSGLSDLINFPLLISIFDSDLQNHTQSDGDDIVFHNGSNWLDHEIEIFNQTYSETHAQLIAWVRIPILYHDKDTIIYMYYGNKTMRSEENPLGVWTNNYRGIWHLKEDPTNPNPQFMDSTSNNNDGTADNLDSSHQKTGIIDGSLSIEDNNDIYERHINISHSISLQLSTNIVVSAWVKTTNNEDHADIILAKWGAALEDRNYWLGKFSSTEIAFFVNNQTEKVVANLSLINDDGKWHYIVGIADANNKFLKIYIDGIERNSSTYSGSSETGTSNLNIGNSPEIEDQEWQGGIDEVRVSDSLPSADWIATEYYNQHDPDSFYSVGIAKDVLSIYDFKYYKEIVIDNTKVNGSENLINFPMLINILDSDLQDYLQPDGDDIAFYNGTEWLDHEIEVFNQTYSETHAQLIAWVRIPSLSPSIDTNITMYFGNSTMGSQQNPNGVWTTEYKAVWHLKEDQAGVGSNSLYKDSTLNSNHGDDYIVATGKEGQINGGQEFDGEVDYIDVSEIGSFTNLTISAWIKPKDWGQGGENYIHQIIGDEDINQGKGTFSFRLGSQGLESYKQRLGLGINISSTEWSDFESLSNLSLNTWQHVAVTFDGNYIRFYIDGNNDNTQSNSGNIINTENDWVIGRTKQPNFRYFDGNIDELRIADTSFTADWIATEYNNQFNPTSFFTIGSKEKLDNTPPTYENPIESSDPLELGETEIIKINISDPFGINQSLIEFEDSNHSMTNIEGNTWQYDSWSPNNIGNYTYTIWMEDNFNNWNSTMGTIEVIDTTPPTYSDLIINADPLQIGQNQTVSIKVFDDPGSGVNQTFLEYDSVNHTMIFVGDNTWNWSKWRPSSEGIHSFKIYMQDMQNNWNITTGAFSVKDLNGPIIENLTMITNPLELGDTITISVDVYDNETSVSAVLIEIKGENRTMNYVTGNTYEFMWLGSSIETINYIIYANDTANNWNSLSNSFTIQDTTSPNFTEPKENENPLELGNIEIIAINCSDLAGINQVLIEYEDSDHVIRNHTMDNIGGNKWQYDSWMPTSTGNYPYKIYIEDNNNNWNKTYGSILVQDTISPVYSDLVESSNPTEVGEPLLISVNVTDVSGIKQVLIEYGGSNHSMIHISGNKWQYDSWMPTSAGNYPYKIYMKDFNDKMNSTNILVMVFQDTVSPVYSDLVESSNPTEVGEPLLISVNVIDVSGIKQVLIEYGGSNHSMIHISGNKWQYDSWMPTSAGNYPYKIYMKDNNDKMNSIDDLVMVFQDSVSPVYSNLIINSNPLELGQSLSILIDVSDFSGINQCLIECEGTNHSMINNHGDTWQYNSWTPNIVGNHSYTIYIEDKNGKWNTTSGNIIVQDTTAPDLPILTISPSGKVSGSIIFDWRDGSDPSGIAYYVLIIDNETNPESTPGYVYKFIITNIGNESSYFELPEMLPPGEYYYFLAQIDGVGQQSDYIRGTFTVIDPSSNNDIMIYIIIGSILVTLFGILTTAIIVRKRIKKTITPYVKKIPLKIIMSHLAKISSSPLVLAKKDVQDQKFEKEQDLESSSEDLIDEKELEIKISEIKNLGEKLFNEGAYLEAQKRFELGKEFLIKHGKEEDAKLFSELSSGIEGLIEEREKRLEILEQLKTEGNAVKIFELYYDIIEISRKLRDFDGVDMYQLELNQFFQVNKFKLINIEKEKDNLEQKADSLTRNDQFEEASQIYKKCEKISELLVQLGKEEEMMNIKKFTTKINECFKKINNKKSEGNKI